MNRNPDVDAFLVVAPEEQRAMLKRIRALIRKSIPQAQECLMNGVPVYTIGEGARCST